MKTLHKFLSLLLLTGVIVFAQSSWASDVTFTAGTNSGSTSVTVSPITMSITGSSPGDLSGNPYKVYADKTLSFSAAGKTITQIVITCTGTNNNSYGPKNLSGTGYTGGTSYTGTWTGSATSVSLSASAQVRFTGVTVTYTSGECQYMVWDGSKYVVWDTKSMNEVVPNPPPAPGYITAVAGDGKGGVAWCTKPISTGSCVSYINNDKGDYKGCWRFVPNDGGSEPTEYNYPNGAEILYPVYQDEETYCFSTGVVPCNSPFGTLSAAGGTTVTWAGANTTKTISLTGKKGSGSVSWSVSPTSIASISGGSSSATLTVKGAGEIAVTCTIAHSGDYCEESKTITITSNPQEYNVNYHLTGVTRTSGPTKVNCTQDNLEVYFNINSGYKSEGLIARVVVTDADSEPWCYSTSAYTGCAVENIELVGNSFYYVNDGVFSSNVNVYIVAQEDVCTNPWMAFATGTNRTVSYGDAGWTDAASVKVSAGGASTGQTITYSSNNSSVASVNSSTGAVTIGNAGVATITATAAKEGEYCEKSVTYTVTVNCVAPTVAAGAMAISNITPTSATFSGGQITSYGGTSSNVYYGYVYSTSNNPTYESSSIARHDNWYNKALNKDFGKAYPSALTPGTTYYVRAYAHSDCGTGYSPQMSFTTPHQYAITYDANGGEGSISDQNKLENKDITLSDGSGFTREGYDLQKWNTQSGGGGTNYTLGASYTGNANLDLYAIWTAKSYTITLNNQTATTTGTTSKTVTFNSNTGLTTAIICPTKTGYTFGGYFTATGGAGTQLIGTDGNWIANADGYTDADKKWQYAGNLELYAKWTANEIELELSANGGESDGSATVLYDATSLKAGTLTHATYEGHTLVGYYNNESHTTKVLSSDGSFATTSVSGYITDGKWSRTTTPTTLYAWWATEVRTVTFDLQGKGDNFTRDVEYNTKVSQPANPTHVDYNFVGWMTTAGGSTSFNFNSNITANTTVYAKWTPKTYENLIFACVDLTLDTEDGDPVLVTSRSGINIMATKKLKVSVSGAIAGHRVTLTGTDLKFYKNDGTRFVELTGANSLTAPLIDQEVYVSYNPSSAGTGAITTPEITIACDGFEQTFSAKVKARNLPESVAIVARVGDTWHALPANMTTEQTPAPIMVSTETAGGIITAKGPSTVQYKLWPVATVNSDNDRFGTATGYTPSALYGDRVRFAGNSNNGLWANNSSANNGIRNYAAITAVGTTMDNISAYEWKITTTEVDGQFVYTLQTQQSANSNNLRMWGNKWGTYGTYGIAELYILPLTVVQTADVTVMEWGTNEIAVKYANAGSVTANSFKAKIGTGSQTAVTCTSLGGDIYKLTGVGNLQNNPAKTLLLNMTENSTAKQAMFAIPLIVTDAKDDAQLSSLAAGGNGSTLVTDGRIIAKTLDVVVRNGGTLSTSTAAGNFKDLYIYPGGKANISNNISLQNIYLRGGFSWLELPDKNEANYRVPQMKVADNVEISGIQTAGNGIYYDFYGDNRIYYMVAIPRTLQLRDITNEENTSEFKAWIKRYDGSRRINDPEGNDWVSLTKNAELVERGKGYELAVRPRNNRSLGILRFPLLKNTAWQEEDDCEPQVVAWGMEGYNAIPRTVNANNVGWNFMGNPFFAAFTNADSKIITKGLSQHIENGKWNGSYDWVELEPKYFTIPSKVSYDYTDVRAADYKLDAFYPFFVQVNAGTRAEPATLSFASSTRALKMPMKYLSALKPKEINIDIELHNDEGSVDIAGFNIDEDYSANFDIDDKEKTIDLATARLKLYTVMDGFRIAFNSLPEKSFNEIPLGYITNHNGYMTISLSEMSDLKFIDRIMLTDHEEQRTVNLMYRDYSFYTNAMAAGNDTRFTISLTLKRQEEVVTPVEDESLFSRLTAYTYNNTLIVYGLPLGSDVWVYDMTGKLLYRNNNSAQRIDLSLPVGVYNVRIISGNEATTLKAFVK